jgi:hypothetical protein
VGITLTWTSYTDAAESLGAWRSLLYPGWQAPQLMISPTRNLDLRRFDPRPIVTPLVAKTGSLLKGLRAGGAAKTFAA